MGLSKSNRINELMKQNRRLEQWRNDIMDTFGYYGNDPKQVEQFELNLQFMKGHYEALKETEQINMVLFDLTRAAAIDETANAVVKEMPLEDPNENYKMDKWLRNRATQIRRMREEQLKKQRKVVAEDTMKTLEELARDLVSREVPPVPASPVIASGGLRITRLGPMGGMLPRVGGPPPGRIPPSWIWPASDDEPSITWAEPRELMKPEKVEALKEDILRRVAEGFDVPRDLIDPKTPKETGS